ncbi:uncharacterized protein [Ptychodera flava]|uniref:uncharacterized protein n=1 Tax=Ptychodera flava TaxID=63121 RepID=UPI00396A8504
MLFTAITVLTLMFHKVAETIRARSAQAENSANTVDGPTESEEDDANPERANGNYHRLQVCNGVAIVLGYSYGQVGHGDDEPPSDDSSPLPCSSTTSMVSSPSTCVSESDVVSRPSVCSFYDWLAVWPSPSSSVSSLVSGLSPCSSMTSMVSGPSPSSSVSSLVSGPSNCSSMTSLVSGPSPCSSATSIVSGRSPCTSRTSLVSGASSYSDATSMASSGSSLYASATSLVSGPSPCTSSTSLVSGSSSYVSATSVADDPATAASADAGPSKESPKSTQNTTPHELPNGAVEIKVPQNDFSRFLVSERLGPQIPLSGLDPIEPDYSSAFNEGESPDEGAIGILLDDGGNPEEGASGTVLSSGAGGAFSGVVEVNSRELDLCAMVRQNGRQKSDDKAKGHDSRARPVNKIQHGLDFLHPNLSVRLGQQSEPTPSVSSPSMLSDFRRRFSFADYALVNLPSPTEALQNCLLNTSPQLQNQFRQRTIPEAAFTARRFPKA